MKPSKGTATETRTVRIRTDAGLFDVETPTVETRFLGSYRDPSTDNPGIVMTDDGVCFLINPDGTRSVLGAAVSDLPLGWQVDLPNVGDFLYGPWPAEFGQRSIILGPNGDDLDSGLILEMVCIAGTTTTLRAVPGDAYLDLLSDSNASAVVRTSTGFYGRTEGTAVYTADGGRGATVALDAGNLLAENIGLPFSLGRDGLTALRVDTHGQTTLGAVDALASASLLIAPTGESAGIPLAQMFDTAAELVFLMGATGQTVITAREDVPVFTINGFPNQTSKLLSVYGDRSEVNHAAFMVNQQGGIYMRAWDDTNYLIEAISSDGNRVFSVDPFGATIIASHSNTQALVLLGNTDASLGTLVVQNGPGATGDIATFNTDAAQVVTISAGGSVLINPSSAVGSALFIEAQNVTSTALNIRMLDETAQHSDAYRMWVPGSGVTHQLKALSSSDNALEMEDIGGITIFSIGPSGRLTVMPQGANNSSLNIIDGQLDFTADATHALQIGAGGSSLAGQFTQYFADDTSYFQVENHLGLTILRIDESDGGTSIGFFGASPVARPVTPVTLGDVISALQALGLVA